MNDAPTLDAVLLSVDMIYECGLPRTNINKDC